MSPLTYISHGNVRETRERYKKEKEEGGERRRGKSEGEKEGDGKARKEIYRSEG
jgi:hypothetical protein